MGIGFEGSEVHSGSGRFDWVVLQDFVEMRWSSRRARGSACRDRLDNNDLPDIME